MLKSIQYTCRLYREDNTVVAVCPELNVSSFGDTPEEAVASLHEAVTLFLEECQRMGTLETVLEESRSGSSDHHGKPRRSIGPFGQAASLRGRTMVTPSETTSRPG